MLSGTRFADLWRWRASPAISTCYASHFNGYFSASSQLEEDDVFLPWLERKANTKISSVLSIGKSAIGRFLFASEAIRAGDCILKVPFDVQISPDILASPVRDLLSDEIGNVAKLALVILLEQKLGPDSKWAPYIIRLPRPCEMHNTIFWNESELEMIRKSSLYEESLDQRSQIQREFLAIKQALETFPKIIDSINYNDFMHAYALVTSRAWRSTRGVSLIPFADFVNHDGASEAIVLNDDDKQLSEVIADRDYAPGDHVQVRVKTVEDDPLVRMKLELWQKSCTPTTKYVNGDYSPGNYFTIREVRSATGKGRGLPQSLRAFARILSCTSPRELNDLCIEAANGDGRLARIPLKNLNKEVEAHRILLSQFKQLVEEYKTSIEALWPVDSLCLCKKLAQRRLMAQHLLTGELCILNSATAWLNNYCDTL